MLTDRIPRRALASGAAGSLLVFVTLLAGCGPEQAPQAGPPPPVLVSDVQQRDVELTLEMVGATLGAQDVPIRARVDGFLESVEFEGGSFVEKGDLLYTIDAQPFQAKLVEAQSRLAAAQTNLAKARADLERIRPLAEMNAVSRQDLDAAVAQEEALRATVRAAEAAVELAEIELSYTRIHAPISGLIGLTQAKPGEYVGREPNPVVLNTLSDIDPIHVRFSISEREYLILARTYLATQGETSDVRRRGARDVNLELILADGSVHPQPGGVVAASQSIDAGTGTYSLEASFPNPQQLLLPGQFARVRAPYETIENAVVIPRRAVSEIQGLFRAFVVDAQGVVEAREISLGPQTGNDVVVETGLRPGEAVIVEGLQRVRPGMTVRAEPLDPPGRKPG